MHKHLSSCLHVALLVENVFSIGYFAANCIYIQKLAAEKAKEQAEHSQASLCLKVESIK